MIKPDISMEDKSHRIFLFYGHVASNIGDLAINTGEMVLLKNSFPNATINVVFFGANSKFIESAIKSCGSVLDSSFVFTPSPSKALKYLANPSEFLDHCGAKDADIIMVASGEFYFSYKANTNKEQLFWRTIPILAAKRAGKQAIILPSTFGPFETETSKELMRSTLSIADSHSARETHSQENLKSMGLINKSSILLDPAFFIAPPDHKSVLSNGPIPKGHLAISMRSDRWGIRLSKEQRQSTSDVRDTLSFQFTKELCEHYLKHSDSNHILLYIQTLADKNLAEAILETLVEKFDTSRIKLHRPNSIEDYLANLSLAKVVVSSRFHAVILSLNVKKPVFGIHFKEHGHKMPGLFRMINAEDWHQELTQETLIESLEKVFEKITNQEIFPDKTQKDIEVLRQNTLNWIKEGRNFRADNSQVKNLQDMLSSYCVEHFIDQEEKDQLDKISSLTKKRESLESDISTALNKLEELKQETDHLVGIASIAKENKLLKRGLSTEKNKLKELANSTSLVVGKQIIKDAKRPLHWPLLPIKLFRIFIRRRRKLINKPQKQLNILDHLKLLKITPIVSLDKRICYVLHNSLPYASGGYATRAHGLSIGLIENGYHIVGLTRPGFPHDTIDLSHKDVSDSLIDGVHYKRDIYPVRKGIPTNIYMNEIIDVFEERFREIRPSVVIAASFHITALPAIIAAHRLNIPAIYELRGLAEITKMSRDENYQKTDSFASTVKLETETANAADHVFTLTSGMKNELVRRGVPVSKITLLPNSCNTEQFLPKARNEELAKRLGISESAPVIGYIGSLVFYEGLEDLVEACGILKKEGVEFRLMIVGSENATSLAAGPITTAIKASAKSHNLDDWLIMPGRVPHSEVESYYSLIDIAPFPRKALPVCEMVSPMKPLEAMAMEKAVVVSSVKALTDMISDGETGLVFEKGNIVSLASVLKRLIKNSSLREDLGKHAREFVKKERTWNSTATKAVPILEGFKNTQPNIVASTFETKKSAPYPKWWYKIDPSFASKCDYIYVKDWELSIATRNLRKIYVEKFGEEAIDRRIPLSNWQRADICWQKIPKNLSTLDVGSGLGEFVNLFAINNKDIPIASVDTKDWDKWFDHTGRIERIYKNIFDLGENEERDVITCFEVIEHLPPERVAEAVGILRKIAKKRLYISVPFLEPIPMYKGHFTRFTETNLMELMPDAKFTVFAKGINHKKKVHAWILGEIDV